MLPLQSPSGAASQAATITYALASTAATYAIPALGGYSGSIALPATVVPGNTYFTLTSTFRAPGGAPVPQSLRRSAQTVGTLNVYFYETIQLSSTVTFPTLPGFSVELPTDIHPAGLAFFYAISNPTPTNGAELQFRTQGPGTVTGQTVTFAASNTPLTLLAGQPYIIAFYASSVVTPTPAPTASPSPGTVTEYSAGISANAKLRGITAGHDGNVWFTEGAGRIGRITVPKTKDSYSTRNQVSRTWAERVLPKICTAGSRRDMSDISIAPLIEAEDRR